MGVTVYNVISSYSPLSQKRKCIQSSTYFISKPKTCGCGTSTGASACGRTGASAGGASTAGAGPTGGGSAGAGGAGATGGGSAGAGGAGGAGATGGGSAGEASDGAGAGDGAGASDGAGTAASSSTSCLMSSSGTQSLYRLYNLTLFHSLHHNLLSYKFSCTSMITGRTNGYVHFKNPLYS